MSQQVTQVGIIGAGPAGLMLGRLLDLAGIDNVVLERQSREYVLQRIRAGLLEQPTVDLLSLVGVDERLRREGQFDDFFELRFQGRRECINMADLTGGKQTVLYPQQEVVKDLLGAREASGSPIEFQVSDVELDDIAGDTPRIRYRDSEGTEQQIACTYIAGCDGFHGVSRGYLPESRVEHSSTYPFGWLGVLAEVPPSTRELIYAHHPHGFAMHSRRSDKLSRLYLQVPPETDASTVPDDYIWEELQLRLGTDDDWSLQEGPIIQKSVTAMRSFVVEPMQHGRLFLAGDSAHIVPPTAAKGLNLAMGDISVLSEGLMRSLLRRDTSLLDRYTELALQRVWRAQEFSRYMTDLLHYLPGDVMGERLQAARLENLIASESAQRNHCEQYVGLPFAGHPEDFIRF